jgi:hypothetical protein
VAIDPASQGRSWHLAMGFLLITGGVLELFRLWRRRSSALIPLALLPLAGFALAVIAIPVAAAS